MKPKVKKIIGNICYPLAVVLLIFGVWAAAAYAKGVTLILPTPAQAFHELFAYVQTSVFWRALANSLWRSFYSFLISFALGLAFALLSRFSEAADRLVRPLMAIVRAVPTMAIIFILVIWFSRTLAPVVIAVIVICPTLYSAFLSAILSVDPKLHEMSKVYGVKKRDMLLKLYEPNVAPALFEGAAGGFSLNIKLIIAAEALASTRFSLGGLMQNAKINLEMEKLFAVTVAAIVLSVLCEWIIRLIGRAIVRWK